MDPLSLSALGAVGLSHAFKFLFDRASATLDRRAAQRTSMTSAEGENSVVAGGEAAARSAGDAATAQVDPHVAAVAAAELAASLGTLQVYRAKKLEIDPQDSTLVQTLHRMHAALEQIEGDAIDLTSAVEASIRVDQTIDEVRGSVIGAEAGPNSSLNRAEVNQRMHTVHEGGSVIGFRAGAHDA